MGRRPIAPLAGVGETVGGVVVGACREPLSGRPLLPACLPRESVPPTAFQRDLSPTQASRFHRAKKRETAPPMAPGATWTRMAAAARSFDRRAPERAS